MSSAPSHPAGNVSLYQSITVEPVFNGSAGRKLESMESGLREVGEEIAGLDGRRNALLAQLAQLEAQLAQAHARRADLEESRNVFEEGVAFSLDALQHQVCNLSFF
jgi:septal ring factor EnvC (AmiA/AmiB activator)